MMRFNHHRKQEDKMFELLLPERIKREQKQFTVTMENTSIQELRKIATIEAMTFHLFIKSILLGFIDYKKKNENKKLQGNDNPNKGSINNYKLETAKQTTPLNIYPFETDNTEN